ESRTARSRSPGSTRSPVPEGSRREREPSADSLETSRSAVDAASTSARMPAMKVFQRETRLRTSGGLTVRDITDEVLEAVHESGVVEGIACVYSPHTTCCVRVNEFESGFLDDFAELLRRLVPSESYYA